MGSGQWAVGSGQWQWAAGLPAATVQQGLATRIGRGAAGATITFTSRRIELPAGAAVRPGLAFRIVGDLTIRGTTHEVALDAVWHGNTVAGFSASTRIDRRDFGLTWNVALETGGVLVGNEVKIELEVQASRQAPV